MELHTDNYYHLYNRSNNNEVVFKLEENYDYFLQKYRSYFQESLETLAYCLMPTHFHFLVYVRASTTERVKKQIGTLLSSYTKAINERYRRHGSLFQEHTKAKLIDDESYLITVLTYIHQNPVRARLVHNIEDWPYSSYSDYAGLRNDSFLKMDVVRNYFPTANDFRVFSARLIDNVRKEYWV